jgi:dihydrofolate reductase
MKITLIAAVSENRVIGRDGGLPWRLPDDLRRFKQRTLGHNVIMGRRTYESLVAPLPDRPAIVVSRSRDLDIPGATIANSVEEALDVARGRGEDEVFILGGSEIYAIALPLADRLELTVVHAEIQGDTYFPEFDLAAWTITEDQRRESDDRHEHSFSFRCYERVATHHSR